MSEMEEKIGAILNNPQMMAQIMSMAQSMSGGQNQEIQSPSSQKQPSAPVMGDLDLSLVQKLSGFAGQTSIDKDQQALLRALSPFLQKERLSKLERAMRAAKIAKFASSALGQKGLQSLLGR